jgi:diguanylate cyclase (GGDEF)-like protein
MPLRLGPRLLKLDSFKVLAATAAVALLLIFVSLPMLAWRIDCEERTREQAVFGIAFDQLRDMVSDEVGAATNWDTALLKIDNAFDPDWVKDIFTDPYDADLGSRLVLVFDAAGNPMLALEHAQPVAPARIASASAASAGLLAQLRVREALRRAAHLRPGPNARNWITGTAVELIEGRPTLLHGSVVGGDKWVVKPVHDQTPIMVFASDIGRYILPNLKNRLLLDDMALQPPGFAGGEAGFDLFGATGKAVARVVWTPRHPGTHLLGMAALPLTLGLGILTLIVVQAYRRGHAATRALIDGEARAQHLAVHDSLTGLPNRTFLQARLARALADAPRTRAGVALLLIDLDRFKFVNDTYGHQCGDEMLKEVGRRLQGVCSQGEVCARLGGDEFVLLSEGGDAAGAASLAEAVLAALARPVILEIAELHTGASIGIGFTSGGPCEPGDLLRQADLALYKSKEQGRGVYRFFEAEMDHDVRSRRGLEGELRRALAEGAIEVLYQPQYDGERMVGVEALARWTHLERGSISPAFFAPLAEECGLIEDLGQLVLRRAFEDSVLWPGLKVAINVSAMQLRLPGFLPRLRALVAQTGVEPNRFELEITEGLLLVDDTITQTTLTSVRAMGFSLALDDFGTGYSSLSYLRRFPISTIKIDQSFTAALCQDREAECVVRAIISLAEALGLRVVAEGVETVAQQRRLAAMGCRVIQGFLTGAPMRAEDVRAARKEEILF